MVSEPVTGRHANENVGSARRVNCEIPHRLEGERKISYKRCGKLSIVDAF